MYPDTFICRFRCIIRARILNQIFVRVYRSIKACYRANIPNFTTCCDATLYLHCKVMCDPEIFLRVLQKLLHYLDCHAKKLDRLTLILFTRFNQRK
jgi:hypothetical protein